MTGHESGRVLDHNIGRLLRRAYVPALPRPEFRSALEERWMRAVRRAHEGTHAPRAVERTGRAWKRIAAVAAALLVAFFAWTFATTSDWFGTETGTGVDELLASGAVAVREPGKPSAPWRAATDAELARGLVLGPNGLEVCVPERVTALVRVANEAGRVLVHAASHVTLTAAEPGSALRGRLDAGTITLDRADERAQPIGEPWRVRTDPGTLTLVQGAVDATKEGSLERFLLARGEARYEGPAGSVALGVGQLLRVIGGVPEVSSGVAANALAQQVASAREVLPQIAPVEPEADAPPSGLRGSVVDATGAPVQRFRVALLAPRLGNSFEPPLVFDFESEDGAFLCADIAAGAYTVFVHAAGLALANLGTVEGLEDRLHTLDRVVLDGGAAVRGFVVDPATGTPVPNALVYSEQDTPQTYALFEDADRAQWIPTAVRTDAGGGFELPHLSIGTHTLRITATGFAPAWKPGVTVTRDGDAAPLRVELEPGGSITGTVAHDDGTPWASAALVVVPMDQTKHPQMNFTQTFAGPDGSYRFDDLPTTSMLVVLFDRARPTGPRVKPVEVRSGQTAVCDFESAGSTTRLVGRLRSPVGAPIAFQNVALFDKELATAEGDMSRFDATTTLADGSYVFERVPPGAYLVYAVEKTGRWIRLIGDVDVPRVQEYEFDLTNADFAVRGAVRDGRSGAPLADANVVVSKLDEDGRALFAGALDIEADGSFEMPGLNAGTYVATVYPHHPELGFLRSRAFALGDDEPFVALEFDLSAGAGVDVEVVDAGGAPIAHAVVLFVDEDGNAHTLTRTAQTDGSGRFRSLGLRVGTYRVIARHDGFEDGVTSFECRAGRESSVRIVLATSLPQTDPTRR